MPSLSIDPDEVTNRPRELVNHDAVRADLAALAERGHLVDYRAALLAVVLHVPALLGDVERLRLLAVGARREYANLRAAARAALAAEAEGEPDPLGYLRDELPAVDLATPTERGGSRGGERW
ncbi:MAG TPA: hypothetical protein VE196_09890 [Pseudonocardiaceae bacterium]|jgi:hypothetical protein|nr:hypothetical protein [Pseudonocardiaceae bacterium]